jgi:hypothetical protein
VYLASGRWLVSVGQVCPVPCAEQMVMSAGMGIVAQPASAQVAHFRQNVQSDQFTQYVVDGGSRDVRHHDQDTLADLVNRKMAIISATISPQVA